MSKKIWPRLSSSFCRQPNPNLVLIFAFSSFRRVSLHGGGGDREQKKECHKIHAEKKFEKFVEKVCYDAWWHQKEEEEERVIRRRPKYYLLGLLAVDTVLENHPICRLWIFQFGPFQPIFVPLKLTCRFARHVECDFWGDFQPLWTLWKLVTEFKKRILKKDPISGQLSESVWIEMVF